MSSRFRAEQRRTARTRTIRRRSRKRFSPNPPRNTAGPRGAATWGGFGVTVSRRTSAASARDAPAPRPTSWPSGGQQAGEADRLTGFLAPAVRAVLDAPQRLIDFFMSLRSRSRVRSSRACSSSMVARSADPAPLRSREGVRRAPAFCSSSRFMSSSMARRRELRVVHVVVGGMRSRSASLMPAKRTSVRGAMTVAGFGAGRVSARWRRRPVPHVGARQAQVPARARQPRAPTSAAFAGFGDAAGFAVRVPCHRKHLGCGRALRWSGSLRRRCSLRGGLHRLFAAGFFATGLVQPARASSSLRLARHCSSPCTEKFFGEIAADEDEHAFAPLGRIPGLAEVAAHEHVHALEYDPMRLSWRWRTPL